ncbi:hypothetical protein K227x_45460 [Rubripirellula lacrimiformis]|uniref:Uncharacterized protein n=1 Tax=Rubripirellula lacrimiformis TaxID=1930273 RepID=A0A517NGC5_9BACT|nr:hypothetical protein K227x_45460 [Rubripirellula lacrimiformis]
MVRDDGAMRAPSAAWLDCGQQQTRGVGVVSSVKHLENAILIPIGDVTQGSLKNCDLTALPADGQRNNSALFETLF